MLQSNGLSLLPYDKLCSGYDIDWAEELTSAKKDEMALEAPTSEALYGCLGRFDRLGQKSSLISGGDGISPHPATEYLTETPRRRPGSLSWYPRLRARSLLSMPSCMLRLLEPQIGADITPLMP